MTCTRAGSSWAAGVLAGGLVLWGLSSAAFADEPVVADNPGGERLGEDEDWPGYPADSGEAGDAYYDPSAEYRRYSPNWTGAFVGFGAEVGGTSFGGDPIDGRSFAPSASVFVQGSTVNHIGDVMLDWHMAWPSVEFEGLDDPVAMRRMGTSLTFGLHPLFLSIIGGDTLSYIVADFAVLIGPTLEWSRVDTPNGATSWRSLGWHIGASMNLPLDSVHDGGSSWLGLVYRYRNVAGDPSDRRVDRQHLREHTIALRFTLRRNGNVTTGFPGPDSP